MYSKNALRIYSFVISIIITFCIRQCGMKIYKISNNIKEQIVTQEELSTTEDVKNEKDIKEATENIDQIKKEAHEIQTDEEIWQLMIPKIDLIAPIEEGTEQSTIKKAIGHFERNRHMGRKYWACSS